MPDVTMRVWRGDASGGDFRDYRVDAQEGEVVLDVLLRLQATQANDLAVRWNCKAGRCGSGRAGGNRRPPPTCPSRGDEAPRDTPPTRPTRRTVPVLQDPRPGRPA